MEDKNSKFVGLCVEIGMRNMTMNSDKIESCVLRENEVASVIVMRDCRQVCVAGTKVGSFEEDLFPID